MDRGHDSGAAKLIHYALHVLDVAYYFVLAVLLMMFVAVLALSCTVDRRQSHPTEVQVFGDSISCPPAPVVTDTLFYWRDCVENRGLIEACRFVP